tara:strand:- start:3369 stop:3539 length:171 start_codon:yes stop_codon:yes gene_type:complete
MADHLTKKEMQMLLDVAKEIGEQCEKNKETKEDAEHIIVACLHESTKQLLHLKANK